VGEGVHPPKNIWARPQICERWCDKEGMRTFVRQIPVMINSSDGGMSRRTSRTWGRHQHIIWLRYTQRGDIVGVTPQRHTARGSGDRLVPAAFIHSFRVRLPPRWKGVERRDARRLRAHQSSSWMNEWTDRGPPADLSLTLEWLSAAASNSIWHFHCMSH